MQNGISSLIGEDGRALYASVKDLPPDQRQQHIANAAQTGLVPFPVAIALQYAVQNLVPQVQAPPPGNVVSELQGKLQAALSGQPVAPQTPPSLPAQPSAGLAGLPVSNIGTQNMASGGIVAFDNGGGVGELPAYGGSILGAAAGIPYSMPTEPTERDTSSVEDLYRSFFTLPPELQTEMTRLGAIKPPDEKEIKEKELKEFMSGDRGKALKTREETLTAREAKNKERFGKEGRWARAAGFFKAAEEAGKPGTTLLGALSGGLGNMARANAEISDKIETAQQALEDQKFAVQQAREELNAKGTEAAQAAYDKELARYDAQRSQLMSMALAKQRMQAAYGSALIKARGKGSKTVAEVYAPRLQEAQNALDAARSRGNSADIARAEQALAVARDDFGRAKQAENMFDPKIREQNMFAARREIIRNKGDTDTPLGAAQEALNRAQARYSKEQTPANYAAFQKAVANVKAEEAIIWETAGFNPEEIQGTAARTAPVANGGGGEFQLTPEQEALIARYSGAR